MTARTLAAALPLALAACAWTGPGVPMKLDTGAGARASVAQFLLVEDGTTRADVKFEPGRVDGLHIEVAREDDGTWVGLVQDFTVPSGPSGSPRQIHTRLEVEEGRIVGHGLTLAILEDAASRTVTVRGLVGGRRVFVEVTPDEIRTNALTLRRKADNVWRGPGARSGTATLHLEGEAAAPSRSPAYYLALVDALI